MVFTTRSHEQRTQDAFTFLESGEETERAAQNCLKVDGYSLLGYSTV
jgi:hypothetical protein